MGNDRLSRLKQQQLELIECLEGDVFVNYCENDEDIDDMNPQMKMAADRASLKVLTAEIDKLEKARNGSQRKDRLRTNPKGRIGKAKRHAYRPRGPSNLGRA